MTLLDDEEPNPHRERLHAIVAGALKSAVDAHGPITRELVGSAAKRIVGQLFASKHTRVPIPVVTNDQLERLERLLDSEALMTAIESLDCALAVLREDNHPEGWCSVEFVERADTPVAIVERHRLARAPREYKRKRDGKKVVLSPDAIP